MILDNLEKIRYRVRAAARRSGRDPNLIRIVAVTKYAAPDAVRELLELGAVDEVGENRVQEAQRKKEALGPLAAKARWRLIGHLQTNKAKQAARLFDAVDSIDALRTAQALESALAEQGRRLPALIQVKLSERETQSGVLPDEVSSLLTSLAACPHLDVRGVMAIAPNLEPVAAVRPHLRRVKELFDRHFGGRPDAQLSMGMSRDFEIAVEEGATHLRLGSSIFS